MRALSSPAAHLVPNDRNRALDVFVRDRSCGDGAVGPGEQCDDGNEVDGDGCDADCRPSICSSGATIANPSITLAHIGAPAGDASISFKGRLALGAAFDLLADGLELRLVDLGRPGSTLLELTRWSRPVPPGAPGGGCGAMDGWTAAGSGFVYRNASGAIDPPTCPVGSANGLGRVVVKRGADGRVSIAEKTKGSTVPAVIGPVRATIVLGGADAGAAGVCGQVAFSAAGCTARGSGETVRCR